MKNEWKKCSAHPLNESSNCFWQKKLYQKGNEEVYADIIEYDIGERKSYELDIQIPEELSITKMTTNIKSFSYTELDFKKMEKHAKKIIKTNIKLSIKV